MNSDKGFISEKIINSLCRCKTSLKKLPVNFLIHSNSAYKIQIPKYIPLQESLTLKWIQSCFCFWPLHCPLSIFTIFSTRLLWPHLGQALLLIIPPLHVLSSTNSRHNANVDCKELDNGHNWTIKHLQVTHFYSTGRIKLLFLFQFFSILALCRHLHYFYLF